MAINFSLNGKTINVTATGFKTGSKGKVVKPNDFLNSLTTTDRQTVVDFCRKNNLHTKFLPTMTVMIGSKSASDLYNQLFPSIEVTNLCVLAA